MKITNNYNLPQVLVDIAKKEQWKPTPNRYSVTEIMNSIKEIVLKRRHYDKLEDDVSEMTNALFGQAFHKLMEQDGGDIEGKIEYQLENGLTISGRYDKLENYELIDYKTTTTGFYMRNDFSDYRKQGLMYAWILHKRGVHVSQLKFYMFLKDFQLLRTQYDKNYPLTQIVLWEYKINSSDLFEIEQYINDRLTLIDKYIDAPFNELPQPTNDELWYTGTKYAVMKRGSKRAMRLFDDKQEAFIYLLNQGGDYIDERQGEYMKLKYSSLTRKLLEGGFE